LIEEEQRLAVERAKSMRLYPKLGDFESDFIPYFHPSMHARGAAKPEVSNGAQLENLEEPYFTVVTNPQIITYVTEPQSTANAQETPKTDAEEPYSTAVTNEAAIEKAKAPVEVSVLEVETCPDVEMTEARMEVASSGKDETIFHDDWSGEDDDMELKRAELPDEIVEERSIEESTASDDENARAELPDEVGEDAIESSSESSEEEYRPPKRSSRKKRAPTKKTKPKKSVKKQSGGKKRTRSTNSDNEERPRKKQKTGKKRSD